MVSNVNADFQICQLYANTVTFETKLKLLLIRMENIKKGDIGEHLGFKVGLNE